MASAIHVEKPEQPELAKHDSTILGQLNKIEIDSIDEFLQLF